jgi:hypothetical protein
MQMEAVQTVQEIVAHLNGLKNKENLAVIIEVSGDGRQIVVSAENRSATFHMERTTFPNEGKFLVAGYAPPTKGWMQAQVVNGMPRREREPDRAVAEAEAFMRRFNRAVA